MRRFAALAALLAMVVLPALADETDILKGKTIRGIQDETGAELTVDDTGLVTIAAVGGDS